MLISTDVLSEGLNLQDATRLINYDLHWNPVRLMQRIGRVDRRMNPEVEERLLADHPEQRPLRGKIAYWNFLPPDELEQLLLLFRRVSNKTLQISKTFRHRRPQVAAGPTTTSTRSANSIMPTKGRHRPTRRCAWNCNGYSRPIPSLAGRIDALPGRVFSGKKHPTTGTQAVFFCYRLPRPDLAAAANGRRTSLDGRSRRDPLVSVLARR